jgi:pimeloyl-ACP methyl ester carboxylesterase
MADLAKPVCRNTFCTSVNFKKEVGSLGSNRNQPSHLGRFFVTESRRDGVRDRQLERPDGRVVAWSEFGDEDGLPILRVPGIPGCRYSLRADRTPWTQRNLGVITTERPGFGASSRLPGRRFREPADDLPTRRRRL